MIKQSYGYPGICNVDIYSHLLALNFPA